MNAVDLAHDRNAGGYYEYYGYGYYGTPRHEVDGPWRKDSFRPRTGDRSTLIVSETALIVGARRR